jgi:hypothetical protein
MGVVIQSLKLLQHPRSHNRDLTAETPGRRRILKKNNASRLWGL